MNIRNRFTKGNISKSADDLDIGLYLASYSVFGGEQITRKPAPQMYGLGIFLGGIALNHIIS